jgi:hypothetical protein
MHLTEAWCLQFDAAMEARTAEAAAAGKKLVYVGAVDVDACTCTVSLQVPSLSASQTVAARDLVFHMCK